MQQRQLRLGDILDDYCPRERRLTNHVVVAMVESDVKQTRCTTCDADHVYKHAKVPRQRRKGDTPAALYAQVAATASKRVAHESAPSAVNLREETRVIEATDGAEAPDSEGSAIAAHAEATAHAAVPAVDVDEADSESGREEEAGPVHRTLIRASLPKTEGQPPPSRPIPEFTIRQPAGRQNRFRPRHERGGQPFQGNRSDGSAGGGPPRGGMRSGGRPPQGGMLSRSARHRGGPKRPR